MVGTSVPSNILSHPDGEFGRLVVTCIVQMSTASRTCSAEEVAVSVSGASSLLKFVLDGGIDAQVAGLFGVAHMCKKLKFRKCQTMFNHVTIFFFLLLI